ncbi:peptidoglycan D,D-transpeptidase FtsI family protein [Nocardiopsis lambiniae]|uniref:Penicillin-binding protein 2 n=1 Tax=Nocardiopsis lambiniae TaxID=3075539 RepID=A0ABU2MG12_9ACTN|nr:penicillin-binding protein 2 [Nocardiopsis sp. DSM 44743]MDT0331010.1 penicillin-binding protein 2 [Nocardiopsis sp. DSM 44743]
MNTTIRRLSIFCLFMFLVLMVNVTWIQGLQAPAILEDPLNKRQFAEQISAPRGPIQAGGENIAYSENIAEEGRSPRYQRIYEGGQIYTPIVGSFRNFGASGIEAVEDDLLNGSDDRLAVRNFRDMITGRDPEGAQVQLTLVPEVQQAGYDAFEALGGRNGAAVALDPETGAILGAISYPSYDPTPVVDINNPGDSTAAYVELENDPNKPLLNRALNERYPPGSTFKVVTAAAVIENLDATPDSTIAAPDLLEFPSGPPLPNAMGSCNGGQPDTLAHSIQISCNTSFANWAMEVGGQALSDQATAFGFNPEEQLTVPLSVVDSYAPAEQDTSILGRAGIGQSNVESTPLQMAMVAAGVANGGEVMRPYVVDSVRDSDLSVITQTSPETHSQAVSARTADMLTEMMVLVTTPPEGGGTNAAIPGIEVAGKTGTAENGTDKTHNWFIGFAPADDPQIAVAVVVEFGGGTGNELAAPVAKALMEAVVL